MLNGKASGEDSTALERARAWRREGLALRRALTAELSRETEARDQHAARVREIEQALAELPSEEQATTEGTPQGVLLQPLPGTKKRTLEELSATELVRVIALVQGGGRGRARDIVGTAKRVTTRHPPRALYNALHRLVKIEHMSSAGSQGEMLYTLTGDGRHHAEELAATTDGLKLLGGNHVAA